MRHPVAQLISRLTTRFTIAALLCLPLPASGQVVDFCDLLDASLIAGDGQFIGRITPDTTAVDSIVNPFGDHGSDLRPLSIFNMFGTYGGTFSLFSPYNPTTFFPPTIVQRSQSLGRLTVNQDFPDRVDPDALMDWLRSDEPALCFQPTPTATATATVEATETPVPPTQTASPTVTPGGSEETPTQIASPTSPPPPPPTRRPETTPSATRTPSATATRRANDDEGCAVVAPDPRASLGALLVPLALMLLARGRKPAIG